MSLTKSPNEIAAIVLAVSKGGPDAEPVIVQTRDGTAVVLSFEKFAAMKSDLERQRQDIKRLTKQLSDSDDPFEAPFSRRWTQFETDGNVGGE